MISTLLDNQNSFNGPPVAMSGGSGKIEIWGTFGGATVTPQIVHDEYAEGWQPMRDESGVPVAFTSAINDYEIPYTSQYQQLRLVITDATATTSLSAKYIGGVDCDRMLIPSDLSPDAWYTAQDESPVNIVSSLGAVAQLTNKMQANYHQTQGNASLQPLTGTRTIAGRNVLDFTNDALSSNNFPAITNNSMIIGLVSIDTVTDSRNSLFCFDGGSPQLEFRANSAVQFNGTLSVDGAGNDSYNISGGPYSGVTLFAVTFDLTGEGKTRVWMNGVERGSGAYVTGAGSSSANRLHLMQARNANTFGAGAVAECIAFGSVNHVYRQMIEGYLCGPAGYNQQQLLPADHPYKTNAPRWPQ